MELKSGYAPGDFGALVQRRKKARRRHVRVGDVLLSVGTAIIDTTAHFRWVSGHDREAWDILNCWSQ